jgi:hypothetical protein
MQQIEPSPQVRDILGVFAELLRGSWKVLAILLAGLALSFVILRLADGLVFGDDHPDFAVLSFTTLGVPFFAGAAAHRVLWNWTPGLSECFDVAGKAYFQLLAVIAISRLIIGFGFNLLVLPGFAAIIFLSLAPVITVAEGPGIFRAISESARRIAGAFIKVLLAYGIFLVGLVFAVLVFSIPLIILSGGGQTALFNAWFSAFLSLAHLVFAAALYLALNGHSGPQPGRTVN